MSNQWKNAWRRTIGAVPIVVSLIIFSSVSLKAAAAASQVPLYLTTAAAPLMMLTMSRDEQLFKKAYTDYTDLDGDGLLDTTYQDDFSYSGYFDPHLCYSYGSSRFKAAAAATDINGNGKAHECGSASAGRWSGNFLNWVAMSRIDVLRFVLYGGNRRSNETSTLTVLERAHIPNDLHAWAKVYSGSDIANYTPFTGTQSFCNASFSADGTPRIRRAPGNWSEWAATSISQCLWNNTSDAPTEPASDSEYVARVEVCDPATGAIRESFCKSYGTSYKPAGLLQEYGEPQAGKTEGSMRFGLLSGSFSNPRSGGVLRRNIGKLSNNANVTTPGACTTGDEIDLRTGVFCNQGDGAEGIINAMSRFKLTQWGGSNWSDCNAYGILNRQNAPSTGTTPLANPGGSTASNRRCSAWGNPISEIYAEALRYISAEGRSDGFGSGTDLSGLPAPNWSDPYRSTTSGGSPYCANCNVLVLSSGLSSFDSDEIPSSSVLERSAAGATKLVGDLEGITGNQYLVGRMVDSQGILNVGQSVNTHEDLCQPLIVTDLGLARGLCPDIPSQEGSYLMAGLAFQARTQDMWGEAVTRPPKPASHDLTVNTYTVALAENLPKFDIPIGSSKISFAPLCQANNTGTATASSADWRSCYLGSVSIGSKKASVSPNYVYGRELESDGSAGSFSLVWEDSQWGNDHDNDVVTMITYCVGAKCNLKTMAGSRKGTSGSLTADYNGNDICWRADTTLSPICSGGGTPAVGANEVLIRIENLSAYAGNAMLTGYSIAGSNNDGLKRVALRPGSSDNSVLTNEANPPTNWTRPHVAKYTLGTSDVKQLENPLWYAAKYGGFVTLDSTKALTPQAQGQASWDKSGTGVPDTFFKVTDPAKLKESLGNVFSDVLARNSSASAIATNSTRLDTETLMFQAKFNSADWSGQLIAYRINENGTVGAVEWDTNVDDPFPSNSNSRKIFTWSDEANSGSGGGVEFEWSDLSSGQKLLLQSGGSEELGQDRLAWLRGNKSKEVSGTDGLFRKRTYLLGDIVNSDPYFVGAPNFGYEALPNGAPGKTTYSTFRANNAARAKVLYVGANDGMLHAFNATDGSELFAYVPKGVFGNLVDLTSPNYQHKYFVDGAPNVGDAFIGGSWRTILIGTTGAGGSSVFALDVTDPLNFDEDDVLWEIDSSTPGFENLGKTIGHASVGRLKNGQWVAVFGNGYESASGLAVLYVVNVQNGALISMVNACEVVSCTSDTANGLSAPSLLGDLNKNIVAAYAGDLKGNLWKFNLDGTPSVPYTQGGAPRPLFKAQTGQPITAPLRLGNHPSGGYMVYFGTGKYYETGDNQVGSNPPVQSFYGIWDSGTRISGGVSSLQEQEIIAEVSSTRTDQSGVTSAVNLRAVSQETVDWDVKRGWYMDLVSPVHGGQGERVVSSARLRYGRVIFPTVIPSSDPCEAGGTSWLMEVDALTGARLDIAVFDLDGNLLFNNADFIEVDDQLIPASGLQSNEGIIKTPAITSAGDVEYKYAGGSTGGVFNVIENPGEGGNKGRQSWRELR